MHIGSNLVGWDVLNLRRQQLIEHKYDERHKPQKHRDCVGDETVNEESTFFVFRTVAVHRYSDTPKHNTVKIDDGVQEQPPSRCWYFQRQVMTHGHVKCALNETPHTKILNIITVSRCNKRKNKGKNPPYGKEKGKNEFDGVGHVCRCAGVMSQKIKKS